MKIRLATKVVPGPDGELVEEAIPGAWICLCGNTPLEAGFWQCDAQGEPVEPTRAAWTSGCLVCGRCGRIIHQRTLAVVGERGREMVAVR